MLFHRPGRSTQMGWFVAGSPVFGPKPPSIFKLGPFAVEMDNKGWAIFAAYGGGACPGHSPAGLRRGKLILHTALHGRPLNGQQQERPNE